jgi:hypothetical protein
MTAINKHGHIESNYEDLSDRIVVTLIRPEHSSKLLRPAWHDTMVLSEDRA